MNMDVMSTFLKRFGKTMAIAISILVIVLAALAFLIPTGAATIPLISTYTVGETLIYQTTQTRTSGDVDFQTSHQILNSMDTQTVESFDGQIYIINHTQVFNLNSPDQFSHSFNQQLSKTGYSELINSGPTSNQTSLNQTHVDPVLAFLAKPEVKVGDTEVIPLSNGNDNITGNVTVTFVDIQNITVAAGTFNVFRVDAISINTTQILLPGSSANVHFATTIQQSLSGQSYVEYDTGKLIARNFNASVAITSANPFNNSFLPPFLTKENNYSVTTQLTDDLMPGQALPSPPPLPGQQEALVFLQNVTGLDMGNYSIQSQRNQGGGYYTCNLTSSDSSLQVFFRFVNGQAVMCRLSPLQGSPDFAAPSNSNVEAAMVFLGNYQPYSQAPYIESLRSTLGSVIDNTNTTVTQGTLSLSASVSGNVTEFVWINTNTGNCVDRLSLTIQNGSFSFFYVYWT
jgi:hypothetical protein